MDARIDGASARWQVISNLRVSVAKLQEGVAHLSEGKRLRARRMIDELDEMLAERQKKPTKTKVIKVGPKIIKRPNFHPSEVQRRQQQLYSDE